MHQKVNVLIFLSICSEWVILIFFQVDHFFVFSYLHFLFPSKNLIEKNKFHSNNLCHGRLPFSTIAPLLPLPLQNPLDHVVDNVGLKICLLGTSNFMVAMSFCPKCKTKWSWDEFNNQSQSL